MAFSWTNHEPMLSTAKFPLNQSIVPAEIHWNTQVSCWNSKKNWCVKSHQLPHVTEKSHQIPSNPIKSHQIPSNPIKSHQSHHFPTIFRKIVLRWRWRLSLSAPGFELRRLLLPRTGLARLAPTHADGAALVVDAVQKKNLPVESQAVGNLVHVHTHTHIYIYIYIYSIYIYSIYIYSIYRYIYIYYGCKLDNE